MNKEIAIKALIGTSIFVAVILSGFLLADNYFNANIISDVISERLTPLTILLNAMNIVIIAIYRKNNNRTTS